MKSMRSRMVANALLFSLLLAAGCATHRLRQAQDLFSRAASVENRSRDTATLAEEPDLGMVDHSAALNDYRMALGLINESLDRARRDLIQDDLLGTAYVLKALCLWRIADLESDTNVVADLDRLLAASGNGHSGFIHSLERFHPRLAIFVVLVVVLGVAIYRYAVPALVEVAIAVTPPVVPELLSQAAMTSLDQTVFSPSQLDAETQSDITAGFRRLADIARRGAGAFTLNFRKGGPIGPNAFALPDGTLVHTDELVELTDDEEAILGVLAHEIGHVELQHSLRQLYRAAGVTGLIFLIGGDIGAGAEDILIQGAALASLSYSRAAEAEADRYSVELMLDAGRDPMAIVRFLELLRDRLHDTSEADFLSSHPATPTRIEETRQYAEKLMAEREN